MRPPGGPPHKRTPFILYIQDDCTLQLVANLESSSSIVPHGMDDERGEGIRCSSCMNMGNNIVSMSVSLSTTCRMRRTITIVARLISLRTTRPGGSSVRLPARHPGPQIVGKQQPAGGSIKFCCFSFFCRVRCMQLWRWCHVGGGRLDPTSSSRHSLSRSSLIAI